MNSPCEHYDVVYWVETHERATLDKRSGSTGKTYLYGGWKCGECDLPFYPHQKNHQFVSSRQPVDEEVHPTT